VLLWGEFFLVPDSPPRSSCPSVYPTRKKTPLARARLSMAFVTMLFFCAGASPAPFPFWDRNFEHSVACDLFNLDDLPLRAQNLTPYHLPASSSASSSFNFKIDADDGSLLGLKKTSVYRCVVLHRQIGTPPPPKFSPIMRFVCFTLVSQAAFQKLSVAGFGTCRADVTTSFKIMMPA